jgi:hypothetical protein
MILVQLKRRLFRENLSEEEKVAIQSQIEELEAAMGLE